MTKESSDPLIGEEVAGRYRVVRRIGRGGMGSIYEVHHTRLDRSFAMKTLAWDVAQDAEVVARFRREADVIAKLRHPHIVEIVDWDSLADGSPCLIMEYLRGEDLSQRIRTAGPMRWNVLAQIADQVMSALVVAHQAGVVHRDLKPQNIFITVDDSGEERAKLLDFGVSKITGVQSLTTESRLIGTPSYMSPEQAEGQQDTVGEPTDVWAMGAILYEMATASPAFEAANLPAILYQICHGSPGSLAAKRVDAPAAFVELVERALTRDPERRLTRIHTLRSGLRRALTGIPGVVYAEPLRTQTPPLGTPVTIGLDPTVSSGSLTPAPMVSATTLSTTAAESFGARAMATPLAAKRRSPVVWIGAAAVVLVVVIAIVVLATGGEKPVVAVRDAAVAEPDAARVAVAPPPDAAPVRPRIKHAITSNPAGARVMREADRQAVGVTPLEVELEPDGSFIGYLVEKPGFIPVKIKLEADHDRGIEVPLKVDRKPPVGSKPPVGGTKPPGGGTEAPKNPPETPKTVPCRKKGEVPNPFEKRPPCPA